MRCISQLVLAAVSCGIGFGCDSSGGSTAAAAGGAYEALANQLQNCGSAALDCMKAASCDATKESNCRDDFDACRNDNGALLEAFQQSIQDCCDTRKECIATARGAAGTAGAGGATSTGQSAAAAGARAWKHGGQHMLKMGEVQACRDDFATCIEDHEPTPPPAGPCMQGFHDCIQGGDQDAHGCVSVARTCFLNRLPTCRLSTHPEKVTP